MKYFNKSIPPFVIGLFILIVFGRCQKFVKIPPPVTQLVTTSVFANNATATAAQVSIYTQMADESWSISQASGLLSDELSNFSTTPGQVQFYTNSMSAINNLGRWTNIYNYIYQANAVLEGVSGNPTLNPAVVKQLIGEAEFLRAFWYFYLTNMYGDIPLVTSTNYKVNSALSRMPSMQVYQHIIADLLDAQIKLNNNFVDASDTTITTTDRGRPTSWAAAALLARVYLYIGDYKNATIQSTSVINETHHFSLQSAANLNKVFLSNSNEAIWQLNIPQPGGYSTTDGRYYILTSAPASGLNNSQTISPQLMNSFETGDQRKINWISSYNGTSPPTTYYFPYKYKSNNSSTTLTEAIMMLRLSEQYLIRAEAEAKSGDLANATADLNTIRKRANLLNTTAATQADLIVSILHESQVELFTEWGHRWFDLIRTGNANTVMGAPGNVYNQKGGTGAWKQEWQLYPIPQSEINNDINLTQNAGY